MAIAENGPFGPHRGRIGNLVYYELNGKIIARRIGISTKSPTVPQLTVRKVTSLTSKFLKGFLDFINTGFSVEAIKARDNAFNMAVSSNKSNLFTGIYPNLKIAYNKLLLSKGPLKPPQDWQVTQTDEGIQYSWATDPKMPWLECVEQAMMLVYFPELEMLCYTLFGNNRSVGTATLEIPVSMQGEYMETYLSFIAADRTELSDSIYTGSFNQQTPGTLKLIQ